MVRVSTTPAALLVALFLLGAIAYGDGQPWPLRGRVDLSSGYGDFRAGRFHVGLDLRTGGEVGAKVYSPVDGYVWRVSMSYRGYGKGLYVKGTDDRLYVFGHLSGFNDAIQEAVRNEQFRRERYYVDLYYRKDLIPVKKGELIAYSGQTGVGAPHLHFEVRTPDNVPLNPLKHGFELDDEVAPTFERIGLQLMDDRSLFPHGRRRLFVPVTKTGPGKFELDTVLYLNAPFGVLVDCYDQMRSGGMRQAIRKLALFIDGVPYYESVLDSLPFEIGPAVNLVFDPSEAASGEKRVRRAYRAVSRDFVWPRARPSYGGRPVGTCAYGLDSPPRAGRHRAVVHGEDAAGNRSEVQFDFEYVGEASPLALTVQPTYRLTEEVSHTVSDYYIEEDGLITLVGAGPDSGYYFFRPRLPTESTLGTPDLLSVLHQGQLLAKAVYVQVVGWNGGREMTADSQTFTLTVPSQGFYRPRFIAAERTDAPDSLVPLLASQVYRVRPEAFPVREKFDVSIKLAPGRATNSQAGLCWFDRIENEWVWIDEDTASADIAAGLSWGGGLFAAIVDTTAPTITDLNLKQHHKYWNRQPQVTFKLRDNLAGFEDDLAIDVRIDGRWLLPQYDIEEGDCEGTLRGPLELGNHVLTISARDRAGNRAQKQVEFEVVRRGN